MERLTKRDNGGNAVVDCDVCELGESRLANCGVLKCRNRLKDRLAAYEDTGLTSKEIVVVKNIVGKLATADYPHNFQRERSDIAAYMYWITSVMKDAKEWWNGRIKAREEAEKALEAT